MNDYEVIFENRPVKTVILRLDRETWESLRLHCLMYPTPPELVNLINEVQRSISSRSAE